MALNESGTLLRIDADVKGARLYNQALDSAKMATDKFGKSAGRVIGVQNEKMTKSFDKNKNSISKWSGQFITSSGNIVQASSIADKNGIRPLQTSVTKMAERTTKATGMIADFTRALKRVMIVVPLWAALRMTISAVTTTVKEGVKAIVTMDKELQRVVTTIELSGVNIAEVLKRLKKESVELSKATGISTDKIINAYYRFSTVGNTVEESFAGMNASVKQAVVLQGELTDIAEGNALVYKLLGHTLDKNLTTQEKQLVLTATTTKLFRTNAFTIKEMVASWRKFLPVASSANFSFAESAALLASLNTASLKGGIAGRLLKTSFIKLVKEQKGLTKELKLYNNASDSSFQKILNLVGALKKMDTTIGGIPESFKLLSKTFGQRSVLPIAGLVAIEKTLKENVNAVTGSLKDQQQQITEQETSYKRMLASAGSLSDQNKNLKGHIGKTFLEGLCGAENFEDALLSINGTLKVLEVGFGDLGKKINMAWNITPLALYAKFFDVQTVKSKALRKILDEINKGIKGDLSTDKLSSLLGLLQTASVKNLFKKAEVDLDIFTKNLRDALEKNYYAVTVPIELDKESKNKTVKEAEELAKDIKKISDFELGADFAEKLAKIRAKSKKDITEIQQGESVTASRTKLLNYTKDLVKQYNNIVIANKVNVPLMKEQEITALALKGNWQAIANIAKDNVFIDTTLLELAKQRANALKEVEEKNKAILDMEQEIYFAKLKASGINELGVAQQKVSYLINERGLSTDNLQVLKAINNIELERLKTISKRVQQIKSVTQQAIRIGIEEGDIKPFLEKFREGMRETMLDSLSAGLNETMFEFTHFGDIMGGVFATAEQRLPMALDTSFETGGDYVALKITEALSGSPISGGAGGIAGGTGIGGVGGTKGIEDAIVKGTEKTQKKSLLSMQDFRKLLGVGMMTFGLLGGGKSKNNISQKYATADGFTGAITGDATTRSTTRAKITNIKIENVFNLEGLSLNGRQAVETFAEKMKLIEKQIFDKLAQEGISSGDY